MIYDGKQSALRIQESLAKKVATLKEAPKLAVVSVAPNPSILSFIRIKKKFGEAIGVHVEDISFPDTMGEEQLVQRVTSLVASHLYQGIIIQLPLPQTFNAERILNLIPKELDVDVLGKEANDSFEKTGFPLSPVAGSVKHILHDANVSILGKMVVVVGRGKLVGIPVATWFVHQAVTPIVVDATTPEEVRLELYKRADIVISGIGSPHHLKKEYFKEGVVLIDAGTSEQSGLLAGDCDPACAQVASLITPVPGGVGPLTVAHLFKNLLEKN